MQLSHINRRNGFALKRMLEQLRYEEKKPRKPLTLSKKVDLNVNNYFKRKIAEIKGEQK